LSDFAEGGADNDADGHIDHIALYRKFSEFLYQAHSIPFSGVHPLNSLMRAPLGRGEE
jgi:hypothetical protein